MIRCHLLSGEYLEFDEERDTVEVRDGVIIIGESNEDGTKVKAAEAVIPLSNISFINCTEV